LLLDFAELAARDRYKLVVSTVVPRPIARMVTLDAAGRVNAAPYSFFNVFADDPVVLGIGVGPRPEGSRRPTSAPTASSSSASSPRICCSG
jgi:flavin reductase (DIM6/NTAB) family NADH-FMN oxidoreductase RutF